MAGRKTIPNTMNAIELFADTLVPDDYLASHPFLQLLNYEDSMLAFEGIPELNSSSKLKSYVLSFDLLRNIFVDNLGDKPGMDVLLHLY